MRSVLAIEWLLPCLVWLPWGPLAPPLWLLPDCGTPAPQGPSICVHFVLSRGHLWGSNTPSHLLGYYGSCPLGPSLSVDCGLWGFTCGTGTYCSQIQKEWEYWYSIDWFWLGLFRQRLDISKLFIFDYLLINQLAKCLHLLTCYQNTCKGFVNYLQTICEPLAKGFLFL